MRESESLGESSGRYAFEQRSIKLGYQSASQAPAAADGGGFGGRGGGLGAAAGPSGGAAPALAPAPADRAGGGFFGGNVTYYDAKANKTELAANCRQIGRKTFFERDGRLVDSTVTAKQEKAATKIERYSREYFDLVERYGQHVAQYLALDEPVVVNLGDETYEW